MAPIESVEFDLKPLVWPVGRFKVLQSIDPDNATIYSAPKHL